MYNLLIVDDETIIADGLQMAVRASNLPLKNVDVVYRAEEALKRMQSVPYDMIVTDVRMPGMDGLALIREAKRVWPRIQAIVLTGNRNFDYVRDAMQLECVDFLIKPARDEVLRESLARVIDRLDREWMEAFSFQWNLEGRPWGGEEETPLGSRDPLPLGQMSPKEVERILTARRMPLYPDWDTDIFLLCFRKNRMKGDVIETGIRRLLNTMYGGRISIQVCPCQEQMVFFIVQYRHTGDGIQESIYKMMEEVQSILYEKQDVRMSVTIRRNCSPKRWEGEALELCRRKENGFVCGELVIVEGEEEGEERAGMDGTMEKIEQYIRQNPEKDLSLGRLAALFCFNSSYLSRAFHQYRGEALSAYITRVRIGRAKELLLKTDLKVYEIAVKSGFETPAYFSRIFSRYESLSPKEYRMRHRPEDG